MPQTEGLVEVHVLLLAVEPLLADCRLDYMAGHQHLQLVRPAELARRVEAFLDA